MNMQEFVTKYQDDNFAGYFMDEEEPILEIGCTLIDHCVNERNLPFKLDQVKTKYGTLRFYYHYEWVDPLTEPTDMQYADAEYIRGVVEMMEDMFDRYPGLK